MKLAARSRPARIRPAPPLCLAESMEAGMSDDTNDAFQQGVDAYGAGDSRQDCPYPKGSDEQEVWLDGWMKQRVSQRT